MANEYVTLEQFASMLGGTVANLNVEFAQEALTTASRDVDQYCGRRFYQEVASTAPAEARTFASVSTWETYIDDAYEAPTIVAVDGVGDGTYTTTLTAAQYELVRIPVDGVALADRPYGLIVALGTVPYPVVARTVNVRVTARWGWAAVPSPVKSATRRLAHLQYEARNAAFGAAGTPETGYIRLRDDKLACQWLDPFVRSSPKFMVA